MTETKRQDALYLAAELRAMHHGVEVETVIEQPAPTTQPAPDEDDGISREQWIEQAMRVYLIAGDTEDEARECAKYLCGELDMDDVADPYDAAMSDVEGRGPAPQQEVQEPVDSMGMPLCGKPLCAPGNHHPLCKLAPHHPAAESTSQPQQPK